jgi:hypothetical protein
MAQPRIFSPKRGVRVRSREVSQRHAVEVHQDQMQSQIKVSGAELLDSRKISCTSLGFRFAAEMFCVNEAKIKRYARGELACRSFSKLLKTETRSGLKQMLVLPQERANRLQWQTERPPRKANEAILACFSPIVENAVVKLTLNKRRGTLLIWYNPQSRRFDVKDLYLYRHMGLKENLEWRWVQGS